MGTSRLAPGALLLAILTLSGCSQIKAGVAAYHAGEFKQSRDLLKKYVQKEHKSKRKVKVEPSDHLDTPELVAAKSAPLFEMLEAYDGSLLSLARTGPEIQEVCQEISTALRPLHVKINGSKDWITYDPKEPMAEFWPESVYTLRAWYANIPCE